MKGQQMYDHVQDDFKNVSSFITIKLQSIIIILAVLSYIHISTFKCIP